MKKVLLLLLSGLAFLQLTYAQDEAIFGHYNITPILVNPSAAGFNETHDLQVNARAQWSGFADAPKTYAAQYNGPLGDNFAIGVGVLSESAAQMQRLRAHLNYAFRFQVSETVKLSAGFQTEYQEITLNNEVSNNPIIDLSDETVMRFLNGEGSFDAALSFFSSFNENTKVGLTFTDLVSVSTSTSDESILKHYMFFASHRFVTDDNNFSFEPSLLIRNVRDVPSQVDINFKAGFLQEQLITGLSYRSLGSLGLLLGTKLSNFQLFYSYDLFFQNFQQYNDGSHEVSLLISLERKNKERSRRY
ncbi:MAG: type IX secretion system membrane protein PorP/SprF [Bacteroidetes bacterium]|jgi:type IX secretion system PorP/SprF family membrane protein|nr:type IX secretion system membrane protein PorP/SprF [Bacteroidota bacterium]